MNQAVAAMAKQNKGKIAALYIDTGMIRKMTLDEFHRLNADGKAFGPNHNVTKVYRENQQLKAIIQKELEEQNG